MAVVTVARLHNAIEAGPMTCLEVVRNDEIEGASDGFNRRKAKNPGRAWIPEADDAGAIGRDDRIRCGRENRIDKTWRYVHGVLSQLAQQDEATQRQMAGLGVVACQNGCRVAVWVTSWTMTHWLAQSKPRTPPSTGRCTVDKMTLLATIKSPQANLNSQGPPALL